MLSTYFRPSRVICEILQQNGWQAVPLDVLPDDLKAIRDQLAAWTEAANCDATFTTGGTGLSPRDVTPEATRQVIEGEVIGLAEVMRAEGIQKNRRAGPFRATSGVRNGKLIVNVPGSARGASESLESILDLLPHAIDIVQGRTQH
ncbi:MAG: MogA/MoaB family molybdenum cofactor biosynthesis protein [Terriglobia bacterium]